MGDNYPAQGGPNKLAHLTLLVIEVSLGAAVPI